MEGPKMRIEGFYEEWKKIHFKEIAQRVSTTKLNPNLPRIEYEDIISGEGCLNKDITKKVSNKSGLYFSPFDLLYGKLRPYIKNIYLPSFEGVAVGDFWILRSLTNCPEFLYFLTNSKVFDKVANVSVGSKMPRADWNFVSNSVFYIPSDVKEQQAIADFFQSLDSMITLTSKKIEKLKQTLTGCMQTMFPQEGELEPKVRFKGFEGEWEKVILSDCLEISNERNKGNILGKDRVLSVSDDYGVMNQIKLLGRSYAGVSVENYKILRKGQIVYTKSPLKSKPYGIIKVNNGDVGIVSVLYAVYNVKEGIIPDYIHFYFEPSYRINNYLLPLINKGAKNTMNISDDNMLNGYIMIPSKDEQSKIADYFASLSGMISLQTKRLDLLKHIKSASLDNMFV